MPAVVMRPIELLPLLVNQSAPVGTGRDRLRIRDARVGVDGDRPTGGQPPNGVRACP